MQMKTPTTRKVLISTWLVMSYSTELRCRTTVTSFVVSSVARPINVDSLRVDRIGRVGSTSLSATKQSRRKRLQSSSSGSTRGFSPSCAKVPQRDDGVIRTLIQNLFAVCMHLQNSELYAPTWADNVHEEDSVVTGRVKLVTSTDVAKGTILTLYPVHALGLRTKSGDEGGSNGDFVVFDNEQDGEYFRKTLSEPVPIQSDYGISVPLVVHKEEGTQDKSEMHTYDVFLKFNPTRPSELWRGHLATRSTPPKHRSGKDGYSDVIPNCIVTPLPGVTPVHGLVAITNMQRGEDLVVGTDGEEDETIARMLQQRYEHELSELQGYLNMAYPSSLKPVVPIKEVSRLVTGHNGTGNGGPPHDDHTDPSFQAAFHAINLDYPGLRYIHRNPDVLVIEDFLSGDECESIIANAEPHLIPCVVKHPTSGRVMQDPSRTSTNANLPQADVPSIVDKLVLLTRCPDPTYLETLQVLRYTQGQQFAPHTDGFDGPTTACGYHQSGRLVTVFCYLNDVAEGGTTIFTKIHADGEKGNSDEEDKLVIRPRQGMAVVHFPATSGFEEDARTEHQGSEVEDHDKWLLTTWMWKDPRTDPSYHESRFPSLFEPARVVLRDP